MSVSQHAASWRLVVVPACALLGVSGCADASGGSSPERSVAASPDTKGTTMTSDSTTPAPVDGSNSSTIAPPSTAPTGFTVDVETFVDDSRPTEPAEGAAVPSRTLVTTLYVPAAAGPRPLIVFAHGINGDPSLFTGLFSSWAAAGYVVAAPAFPLTNRFVPDAFANVGDVGQQTADMRFVIDSVLSLNTTAGSRLFGRIDPERIGVGGLSAGSIAAYTLGFDPAGRDPRVTAVAILDGFWTHVPLDRPVPFLIAHGDADPAIPYATAKEAYNSSTELAWLLTLHGADHATQWEDTPTQFDDVANQLTTDFWTLAFRGTDADRQQFLDDAAASTLVSLEHR